MIQIKLPGGAWKYNPKKQLGPSGGFGAVFAGKSASNERVAVKKLHIDAAAAAHRELEVASLLAGRPFEHVMPVLDAGQDSESNGYFVIMPVADMSLQDLVDKGPVAEREAVEVLRQVARGLTEVADIVHRDLKPANVLLLDSAWRIADFGIARFVEESTSARTLKDCLSPLYAAPEQWRSEHATPATDVYALGCTAYALLTGAPPFSGSSPAELQEKHLQAAPPDVPAASPQMRSLLAMTLRKEPQARPSLGRVIQILEAVAASSAAVADTALDSLAIAAAAHEQQQAEAAAARERARSAQTRRDALAVEAKRTLKAIFEQLARHITTSVPSASVTRGGTSLYIHVGPATLELDVNHGANALPEEAFPLSKWDVICGAIIEVNQTAPHRHKRSANLWYTRQRSQTADYRWYEVGYEGNPLTQRGFEFEPAAVRVEDADRAHAAAMDLVQAAYGPYAIDDEDVDAFCQRWTHILAEACAGRLRQVPRALPPRGPF